MSKPTFLKTASLMTTAIGIAYISMPASATPGIYAGMVGSGCAAVAGHHGKLNVQNHGALYNKNTNQPAVVSCPFPAEYNRASTVYVSWIKRNAQTLSCTVHRRSFDYLSGATSTQNSNALGSSSFVFGITTNYFNSVQCSIPKANGAGANAQSGVNGVLYIT